MYSIAVFFNSPGVHDYPYDDPDYVDSYRELAEELKRRGAELFVVRAQETYLGGNAFSGGWKYTDGALGRFDGRIDADVIFNKGNLAWDDGACVINEKAVEELCTDKSRTYDVFAEHSPRTVMVRDRGELEAALASAGGTVVAKPPDLEGGKGVIIGSPAQILQEVDAFPYLIQEFIDTAEGIPGIMTGHHDLRVASVNGFITHAYYRTPPPGKLTANVSQGGSMHFLTKAQIPEGAARVCSDVDEYMKRFPERIYSVDLGCNRDGRWLIIEMNSKPGLLPRRYDHGMTVFQEHVASLLVRVASAGKAH